MGQRLLVRVGLMGVPVTLVCAMNRVPFSFRYEHAFHRIDRSTAVRIGLPVRFVGVQCLCNGTAERKSKCNRENKMVILPIFWSPTLISTLMVVFMLKI